ncbi:fimbrial protein [Enterobacter cloacae]|uniref:fimbrial protein n=1 Tax=Enterobacter cloacae TaxID=550 RepID=UPI0034A54168
MNIKQRISLSGVVLGLFVSSAWADNMNFHGTLVTPPTCTINNGNTIDVNFGNVDVSKIDGTTYDIQPANYTITCTGGSTTGVSLGVTWTGTATAFDSAAVATGITGFGLHFLLGGKDFVQGQRVAVTDITNPPQLQIVPVKRSDVSLTAQNFTATATLQADYQ